MRKLRKKLQPNTNHLLIGQECLWCRYKEEYFKKHKNNNAYTGSKENSNLKRWFDEKWLNQRGEVGYKKKGDVYRPTKKISNKTPTTFSELSQSQIKKAMAEKKQTGKVKKFKS